MGHLVFTGKDYVDPTTGECFVGGDLYKSVRYTMLTQIPFGKYKGSTIRAVAYSDPQYIIWMGSNGFDVESSGVDLARQIVDEKKLKIADPPKIVNKKNHLSEVLQRIYEKHHIDDEDFNFSISDL